jgi:hypothetical protein
VSETKHYTLHMCQSITGPLMNWKKRDWQKATKYIFKNDGSRFTADALKQSFLEELALGHEVVPIGECDNFDWKKGCQGHPVEGRQ